MGPKPDGYEAALASRQGMPCYKKIGEFLEYAHDTEHLVVLIGATTGAGKTTVIPYVVMLDEKGPMAHKAKSKSDMNVVVTQPRRLVTTQVCNNRAM